MEEVGTSMTHIYESSVGKGLNSQSKKAPIFVASKGYHINTYIHIVIE